MRFLRGLIFSILFYGITAVMAIIGLPLLLLPRPVIFLAMVMGADNDGLAGNDLWITSHIDGDITMGR